MIARILTVLIAGTLAGAVVGQPFAGLAIASLAALVHQVIQLRRLTTRLGQDAPPGARIGWKRMFSGVRTLQEDALRAQNLNRSLTRQWRNITDALPDAGVLLDQNFNILRFNETARQLLRIDGDADTGKPIARLIRNPAFVDAIEKARFDAPIRFVLAREPEVIASALIRPVGEGQLLLLVRDITDRARAERIKTDFVANASHELRTPITVLKGYLLGLSEDEQLNEAWREPVAEMNLHVDRMEALVNDLLSLNEFEAEDDAPMKAVNVSKIIKRAIKEASQLDAQAAPIRVEIESEMKLLGDKSALRSIATNLLTNAVRFTPPDGEIVVRWAVYEDGGRLSVRDTGIGIDPDEIARVTERFYRTDPGRARHEGGTGLGLAIVKHALAMHGGRLQIESELNRGSVFTCHFPKERLSEDQ